MKTDIHPEYTTTRVHCTGCGTDFETRSTAGDAITVDICSNCHPFYTGKQRIVDTGGRVQRFRNRMARQSEK
jgi:large subunit ribosomal protein L31